LLITAHIARNPAHSVESGPHGINILERLTPANFGHTLFCMVSSTLHRVQSVAIAILLAMSGAASGADSGRDKLAKPSGVKAGDTPANFNIPLWPAGQVPLAKGDGPLDIPFLTVFLPPEGKRNGGSVIVAPGGSDIMLMYGVEGMDVAERYTSWGVTAFVLTYRLSPRYGENARVMEGKRAVQVVRSHAAEFKLDPKRVGYIGFSAGSNTARSVVGTSAPGEASAADPIDQFSSRPDYLVLVYGAGRASPGESLKDFPPTFLVSAAADRGPSLANAQLFMDLIRAGVTAEIHVYQKGRHGFGSGFGSPEFSDWMGRLELFLKLDSFLPGEN
jgi:acetyl esterase/lipase